MRLERRIPSESAVLQAPIARRESFDSEKPSFEELSLSPDVLAFIAAIWRVCLGLRSLNLWHADGGKREVKRLGNQ